MSSPHEQPSPTVEYDAFGENETDQLGAMLAEAAEPGLVVGLIGPLGAGKTRFVRATATALGADPSSVNSPTFVLIQEYFGRIPVFHFDTYRLRDVRAFAELGAEEYFSGDGICFVEWADRVSPELPRDLLCIEVSVLAQDTRRFRFSASGSQSQRVLAKLTELVKQNLRRE